MACSVFPCHSAVPDHAALHCGISRGTRPKIFQQSLDRDGWRNVLLHLPVAFFCYWSFFSDHAPLRGVPGFSGQLLDSDRRIGNSDRACQCDCVRLDREAVHGPGMAAKTGTDTQDCAVASSRGKALIEVSDGSAAQ